MTTLPYRALVFRVDIICIQCNIVRNIVCPLYHTEHLSLGFIFDPTGHFQAAANSGLFDNGPSTRNLPKKRMKIIGYTYNVCIPESNNTNNLIPFFYYKITSVNPKIIL